MLKPIILEFTYGKYSLKLETGYIAQQTNATVIASMNETVVIVTVVSNDILPTKKNFLPLSIHYQEKFYSAGKIPGSFFRRESRLSDTEIIVSRLIDRSIRPLLKNNFYDIQIVINVVSLDPQINADIISIIGVSAALSISNIYYKQIIGVAKVGYINNKFILNPNLKDTINSQLELIVSGTTKNILMIDASSNNLKENIILQAIHYAVNNYQNLIYNIKLFTKKVLGNKKKHLKVHYKLSQNIKKNIQHNYAYNIKQYLLNPNKYSCKSQRNKIKQEILLHYNPSNCAITEYLILQLIEKIEKNALINKLLLSKKRLDNRHLYDLRNIDIKINFLPKRVHGSALFTRGETQSLVTVTLGTSKDAQSFDDIFLGNRIDNFIFHYNFPPYSVGEIGNIGLPKRREIGHGYLAKKGLLPVIPSHEKFPYTIRLVSDIMASNGSSSMASVCGASLALMNAGVPIKYAVAGIAMGLITTKKKLYILTDIIGDEDRLGEMDFKIIGTHTGITALQMDIKNANINLKIIQLILQKARTARLAVLVKMNQTINNSNVILSPYVPKIYKLKIDVNKIKDVIGKGGSVIKNLTENNNCSIEIENDGNIKIISNNKKNALNVINSIKNIITKIKIGSIHIAKIIKIVDFGIFVTLLENKQGLLHISQFKLPQKTHLLNYFKLGQYISVKILDINKYGKIKLRLENHKYNTQF